MLKRILSNREASHPPVLGRRRLLDSWQAVSNNVLNFVGDEGGIDGFSLRAVTALRASSLRSSSKMLSRILSNREASHPSRLKQKYCLELSRIGGVVV